MLAEQQGVLHSTAELPAGDPKTKSFVDAADAVEEVAIHIKNDTASDLVKDDTILLEDHSCSAKRFSFLTTVLSLLDAS
jgi:hypothetical protein